MAVSGKDRVGRATTTLVCTREWREFDFGTFVSTTFVTEDDENYYLYDHNDEFPVGVHWDFLTLPKHSWSVVL